MGTRKYKPTAPGRRGASISDFVELTRLTLEKSLFVPKSKTGSHSNSGRITTRHIGGGHKQAYCIIDFKRYDKDGVPAKVARIEHDPNRTVRVTLLHYRDGEKHYIIAPNGPAQGTVVVFGPDSDIKSGSNSELRQILVGTTVYVAELRPGGGAELDRPVGAAIQLVARKGEYAILRMFSDEIRMVDVHCRATIGTVGNVEQPSINWGKAGCNCWKGIRPTVCGVMMNPVDHPHGGGEGRASGGRHLVSPWGKPEGRICDKNRASNRLIARRRKTGKKH